VQLKIIEQNGKRGIEVMWARKGRSGIVIWDDAGNWKGMPEKIEAALYDGLTQKEQEQIEANTPMKFPNPETAISWGYEQGAFGTVEEAKLAYAEVRKEHQPQTAEEMATFWTAEVRARKMERADAA
jgi:hypothetical protein